MKLNVKLDEATRLAIEGWLLMVPGVREDELHLTQEFAHEGLPCQALIALMEDTGESWSPGFDVVVESRVLPVGGVMGCGDGPFQLLSKESTPLMAIETALSACLNELMASRPDWVETARLPPARGHRCPSGQGHAS